MRRYVRDYYVNDFVYLSVQWLWVFHCSECTCHINYWRKDYARMMFALFSSCFLFSIALFSSLLAPSLPVYPNTPKTISHLPEPHILKRNICDINELTWVDSIETEKERGREEKNWKFSVYARFKWISVASTHATKLVDSRIQPFACLLQFSQIEREREELGESWAHLYSLRLLSANTQNNETDYIRYLHFCFFVSDSNTVASRK